MVLRDRCVMLRPWALPGAPGLFIAPSRTFSYKLWNKTSSWKEKARTGELSPALQQPWLFPFATCTLWHRWFWPSPARRTHGDHVLLGSCSQRREPARQTTLRGQTPHREPSHDRFLEMQIPIKVISSSYKKKKKKKAWSLTISSPQQVPTGRSETCKGSAGCGISATS